MLQPPQSGVEAPRLLKRSLPRLYYCCCCCVLLLCCCVVVVCCCVLLCVVVCCVCCCGVLWCVVVCCGVLWCVVVCCGVLWCVVVCVVWCVQCVVVVCCGCGGNDYRCKSLMNSKTISVSKKNTEIIFAELINSKNNNVRMKLQTLQILQIFIECRIVVG